MREKEDNIIGYIDGSSLQWAKPDEQRQLFIQLITQSCLYMAALRCGVDTARLDLSALESVNQFDTNRITLCLGSACQQAARPLMHEFLRICDYLGVTPQEFFTGAGDETDRINIFNRLQDLDDGDIQKLQTFLGWMEEK